MTEPVFDLPSFIAFVASKPGDESFDPWDSNACAGAQYLRHVGIAGAECGVRTWVDSGRQRHDIPQEISDAISWACSEDDNSRKPTWGALLSRLESAEK